MDVCGDNLLLLGTAIAIQLNQSLTTEESAVLAKLLYIIREQLIFLAAFNPKDDKGK